MGYQWKVLAAKPDFNTRGLRGIKKERVLPTFS